METKGKQVRLVEAPGDELAALLAPMTPQTFVSEYWGKKPLYIKGARDKFKGFFDGRTFIEAVAAEGRKPLELRASFDKKTQAAARTPSGELMDVTQAFPIPPELAGPMYEAGATLCATEIESRVPRLAHFVAAIKRQLGYPGRVCFNAYLSAAGSGLNWHFDGRVASTLQIEGSKRWRYSNRTAIDWPRGNGTTMSDGSARYADSKTFLARQEWERLAPLDKSAISEVVLEPGDFLVLPAGTWHDASGGTSGSLALNLSFTPVSYTSIIGDLLDTILVSDPGWRSPKPLLPKPGGLPGEVDSRALEALTTQLQNAAKALQSLAADSAAVAAIWSTYVQNASPLVTLPDPAQVGPIAPTDRFRTRADGNVYPRLIEKDSKIVVAIGGRGRTEAMGEAMRFMQLAIAAREFAASDCLAWNVGNIKLGWGDVEQVLAHLVNEGLLERVTK